MARKLTKGTWAHTAYREIWIPEVQYLPGLKSHTYVALRGSSHTVAVFFDGECVGWAVSHA